MNVKHASTLDNETLKGMQLKAFGCLGVSHGFNPFKACLAPQGLQEMQIQALVVYRQNSTRLKPHLSGPSI